MINSATAFIFIVFFILVRVYFQLKKPRKWTGHNIPGPSAHPVFGNFLSLASLDPVPHRAWASLTSVWGPVLRLVMGPTVMVIIGGYEEIKEAMNDEALDDRTPSPTADLIRFGSRTFEEISFFGRGLQPRHAQVTSVERWRELRRFTLKSLRDLGFGKSCSEEAIIEETRALVENIKESLGGEEEAVLDLEKSLNCASLNIIWNLVAGHRFEYNDEKMKELVRISGEFMGMAKDVLGKPFGFLPFLRFFPPYRQRFLSLSQSLKDFKNFLEAAIIEHQESLDRDSPRDFIDMFLIQAEADTRGIYSREQLIHICMDLFVAGSETTSKSLLYAIACLMRHPDVQTKLQADLDKLGSEDLVTTEHKGRLAYVEATMAEVWRTCNIAPFGPPRHAHQDTRLGDKVIPEGAQVFYNTYGLHMDPVWGDPEVFRPERFLDPNGNFQNNEMLNPFGIGRRRCLGESLARMENFIFFGNIFKTFQFSLVSSSACLPSLEPDVGFTNGPFPFKTRITVR